MSTLVFPGYALSFWSFTGLSPPFSFSNPSRWLYSTFVTKFPSFAAAVPNSKLDTSLALTLLSAHAKPRANVVAARQVLRRCSGAQDGQRLKIDTDQRLESDRKNSRPNCRRDCVEQAMSSRCAGLNPAEAPAPERHLLEHGVVA